MEAKGEDVQSMEVEEPLRKERLLSTMGDFQLCYHALRRGGEDQVEQHGDVDIGKLVVVSDQLQKNKAQWESLKRVMMGLLEEGREEVGDTIQLRYMLMALHLEPVYDYENMDLLSLVIQRVVCAEEALREIFQRWLQATPKEYFLRMVEHLQNNLTVYVITNQAEEDPQLDVYIEQMCMLVERHYQSNLVTRHLPRQSFYLITLEHVDPWRQLDLWRGHNEQVCFIAYPFLLDLDYKYELLRMECEEEQEKEKQMMMINILMMQADLTGLQFLHLLVRRNHLLEDTLDQLSKGGLNYKKELRVQFVGEQGLDEGGVRKELLHLLVQQLFDLDYGMFLTKHQGRYYWFNQHSQECSLNFELIGTLLGLAIYNNINLDLKFPPVIYSKLRQENHYLHLDSLRDMEPEVAASLEYILSYEGDLEEDLAQTFTVTSELYGEYYTTELKPDGHHIMVDQHNKHEYVHLYLKHYFDTSIHKQFQPFLTGFNKVMDSSLLEIFSGPELQELVCGQSQLDFQELEKSVIYKGYTPDHPLIQQFWQLVHAMDDHHQKRLLFFVTGSDRAPVRGLASLQMVIQRHGSDTEQLPSAHTCYNYLLLPEYSHPDQLEKKLYLAIDHAEGFGLM